MGQKCKNLTSEHLLEQPLGWASREMMFYYLWAAVSGVSGSCRPKEGHPASV